MVDFLKQLNLLNFLRTATARREAVKWPSPPAWFVRNDPAAIRDVKPSFLFQPWVPEHTDKLIRLLSRDGTVPFTSLGMFSDPGDKQQRKEIIRFADAHGDVYDRMVMHKLSTYRHTALGLVVTLDWLPAMRRLVYGASRLGIRTILVPHESVFAKENMFYTHPKMGMNAPICDVVLAWGDMQERIFIDRGYPAERILKVGAPKFDYIREDRTGNAKDVVLSLGLTRDKPVMVFAAQPLDSQYDMKAARAAQNSAILDLISIATDNDSQLIIRTPPSKDAILDAEVYEKADKSPHIAIDDASLYLLSAEETIAASDILVSLNSTMLLEAALDGKVAVTAKYVKFEQIWDALKIPVARNRDELRAVIASAIRDPQCLIDQYDLSWAANAFGIGTFDGGATRRICKILTKITNGELETGIKYGASHPGLLMGKSPFSSSSVDN